MTVCDRINALVGYGLTTGLIEKEDVAYTQNRLLALLKLDGFERGGQAADVPPTKADGLEAILSALCAYAAGQGLAGEGEASRASFSATVMGCLLARPSEVERQFLARYKKSPKEATDWFHAFCQDADAVSRYRTARDIRWKARTDYGELDVVICLSRTEEAADGTAYPRCPLCKENVGYAGGASHANLRTIPLRLAGRTWHFRYSPEASCPEQCLVAADEHAPLSVSRQTFMSLFDFVKLFPHYTVGCDADFPVPGASHACFRGGNYGFALAHAPVEEKFQIRAFEDVQCGIVKWPMSVIRLASHNANRIVDLADRILKSWRQYSDEGAGILARTEAGAHNAVTAVARKHNGEFELDVVLRNDRATPERPLGLFHSREDVLGMGATELGLLAVMGLAVLPARLKQELTDVGNAVVSAPGTVDGPMGAWVAEFLPRYGRVDEKTVGAILKQEAGLVFARALEDAGVYKRTADGRAAFRKFISTFA